MSPELKEKCLTRWGSIPTDEEWVVQAMERWDGILPDGYVSQEEKNRKIALKQYLATQSIIYI